MRHRVWKLVVLAAACAACGVVVAGCGSGGPDAISISPQSVTVAPGGTATATVTVAAVNGFTSTVTLSATGLPNGVTASFNPATVASAGTSPTSVLTLTATAAALATSSPANVTVTGTQGTITHSVQLAVSVSPPAGGGGGKIAFDQFVSDSSGIATYRIMTMNGDGTGQTALTDGTAQDFWPRFSSDGASIVFIRNAATIFVMRSDGTGRTDITPSGVSNMNLTFASFSPNGQRVLFVAGGHSLATCQRNGADLQYVAQNPTATIHDASYSPDGSRIVFSGKSNSSDALATIHVINANGTGLQALPTVAGQNAYGPRFSPDGRRIVYFSATIPAAPLYTTQEDIRIMDANGANPLRLTSDGGSHAPAFTSAGRIVFSSQRGGAMMPRDIYVMDANGANATRLTTGATQTAANDDPDSL